MKGSLRLEEKLSKILPEQEISSGLLIMKYFLNEEKKKRPAGFVGISSRKLERDLIDKGYKGKKITPDEFQRSFYLLVSNNALVTSRGEHYYLSAYFKRHYGKVN